MFYIVLCTRSMNYYIIIREYGSTLYVGIVRVVSFSPYIGIGAKFRITLKIAKTRLCRCRGPSRDYVELNTEQTCHKLALKASE